MKAIRRFHVRTVLPEPLAPLGTLASNLRWSWHSRTRDLFRDIDRRQWEAVSHDPVALLASLSAHELDALSRDEAFVARVREAAEGLQRYLEAPQWFQSWTEQAHGPAAIAYFSAEFGITSVLPQYSGGLGILAGDHLKSASDLGVPIVGIGLFYKTGYFSQSLSGDGWQQETYPVLDPDNLPLSLVREADGTPALVSLRLPEGRVLRAHIWKAQVGRVPLLLLDSDVDGNDDAARDLTNRLYGGGGDHRLQQEMLLGIGGVRALRIWSRLTDAPEPEVYHCNEGHAGLLGLERISELVTQRGLTFDEALEAVRAGTVFTTHTPVPAGIDRFGVDQVRRFLGGDCGLPGVPVESVLPLGAEDYDGGAAGVFNMAVMGLRLAQRANGVSQLHGKVSRGMFDGLWPGFDDDEVPITSITNGVHAPTWMDPRVVELAQRYVGGENVRHADGWDHVASIPSEEIWHLKRQLRAQLVEDVRGRVHDAWVARGASEAELGWTQEILDPDVLTIGFARRVPTYKRLTLMLRDPARLRRLLLDPDRPVQLVIAGKAHPADDTGKKLIQQMVQFADDPKIRHRIVFLPNYDIAMAQQLYPGCDVWLNNPLRPFEACGTSGMKAALNGGLNLSILDGWWDEWFDGQNGWAIPTADQSSSAAGAVMDEDRRDDLESAALYDLIESHVRALFYDRDAEGLPQRWMSMVSHTLGTLGPKVLATRMVRDYVTQLYAPAALASRARSADSYAQARELASYEHSARSAFGEIRVDHVDSEGVRDTPQVGDRIRVKADVWLGSLSADAVQVQVVYGRASESDELSEVQSAPLTHVEAYDGSRHRFEGEVVLSRTGAFGYTVRVLPRHEGLASAAELGLVVNA
ncbi:alpha-glucan family phosphorylase [Luteipulveratus flavus]|uniref:glycogen phosphorylase n=1 Tax=Luteipulveratus flavus TaxID=3031728 RepID=A0ABT6CCE5_9MICO|nr:alpha-glucan family phosphorylase [Luteipulveratus sp. YIM 133296]MDF8264941.1 alpha-glucan family phosphorylase [Luteipulveratus sp. YIM 133296]